MPLLLEVHTKDNTWVPAGLIMPTDRPATISDNAQTGREIILLECDPADRVSTIKRSEAGIDSVSGPERIVDSIGFQLIATLNAGDVPFEMCVRTDRNPSTPIRMRVSHVLNQ